MVTEQSDTERVPSMLAVWQLRERVWRAGEDGYHLWPPRGGLCTSFIVQSWFCGSSFTPRPMVFSFLRMSAVA